MYGILHHLFSTVYFLLFQTYCTFVYLFCVLVYNRGTDLPAQPGSKLGQGHLCFLSSLQTTSRWWWSITDDWNAHICQSTVQLSSICENLHEALISSRVFSSNCPCPLRKPRTLLHKFDVSLVRSHREDDAKTENIFIFAAASESKKLDTTKSHAELPKVPKTDYILMFRFWPNFPNSGCEEGGVQCTMPLNTLWFK